MVPHPLYALAEALPLLDLNAGPTREEAQAASRELGGLGDRSLGLARFRGQPPWERHAEDELLIVLAGELELTLRTAEGDQVEQLGAGDLFVVPAGVWHRSCAVDEVTLVYGTPTEGNASSADDPR